MIHPIHSVAPPTFSVSYFIPLIAFQIVSIALRTPSVAFRITSIILHIASVSPPILLIGIRIS
jgi:hypothetical protein